MEITYIIIYLLLAFLFLLEFFFFLGTGIPLFLTFEFIKWILKKILGKSACKLHLHNDERLTEEHTFEFKNSKSTTQELCDENKETIIIYVRECKHCERRITSFDSFDGKWTKPTIKKNQHLILKRTIE